MFCFALFEGRSSSFKILSCAFGYAALGKEIQKDMVISISIWTQGPEQGPNVRFQCNKLDCYLSLIPGCCHLKIRERLL